MKVISHTRRYDWISFLELKSGYERESSVEVFGGKKDPSARLCFTPFFLDSYEEKVCSEEAGVLSFWAEWEVGLQLEMDLILYYLALCSVQGIKSRREYRERNIFQVDLFIDGSKAKQTATKSSLDEMPAKHIESQG